LKLAAGFYFHIDCLCQVMYHMTCGKYGERRDKYNHRMAE